MKWSKDDTEFLSAEYGDSWVEDIAGELGRTVGSIRSKAHRMGLKPVVRRLTDLDINYIMENCHNCTDVEIAEVLMCSDSTVARHRRANGFSHHRAKYDWDSYGHVIRDNWKNATDKVLGEALGVPWSSVRRYRSKHGLVGRRGWRRDIFGGEDNG